MLCLKIGIQSVWFLGYPFQATRSRVYGFFSSSDSD